MDFSQRVKIARISKGLTQKEAAEIFKVGTRHWQKYEAGDLHPTFLGLIQIADFFNVSLDWLAGRSDIKELK